METKKTAIEWLLNEFQEVHKDYGGLDTNWLKRFDKAKEMEKEQMIDSEKKGFVDYKIYLDFSKKTELGKFIFENGGGDFNVTNYININFLPKKGDIFILEDTFYGDEYLLDLIKKSQGEYGKYKYMNFDYKVKEVEHCCYQDSTGKKHHVINILLCSKKKQR